MPFNLLLPFAMVSSILQHLMSILTRHKLSTSQAVWLPMRRLHRSRLPLLALRKNIHLPYFLVFPCWEISFPSRPSTKERLRKPFPPLIQSTLQRQRNLVFCLNFFLLIHIGRHLILCVHMWTASLFLTGLVRRYSLMHSLTKNVFYGLIVGPFITRLLFIHGLTWCGHGSNIDMFLLALQVLHSHAVLECNGLVSWS